MARSKRGHNAQTQARNSRGQFCSEPRVRFIYSDSESDYDSNLVTPAPTLTMAKTKKKSKVQRTRELIIIDSDSDDKVKTAKKVCKGEASTPTKKIYTGKVREFSPLCRNL
ncbi:hypothetical protein SORBI_3008G089366 [Sorghum bicolor]|uniref:Uncharacterized protein n=1 Tax=Sorghum bicolor TaxID=4558 RepID=A0A1Z5R5K3_SORBI|nr:hypothetical protein SORBI_3008G089366 [Sorghum bicolor]